MKANFKFEIGVRHKIISGFLLVAILVVISSITSMVNMDEVVDSTEIITKDKMALKDTSNKALISIGKVISSGQQYVNQTTNLDPIKQIINKQLSEFEQHLNSLETQGGKNL